MAIGGSLGISGGMTVAGINIQTPDALDASAYSDTDVTVGSTVTSSLVAVTIDNDSTDEEADLQDGTTAGEIVIFVVVAGADSTDDSFIIDVATDSTCLNCTSVELNDVGESANFIWMGSAWWYSGGQTVAD